ncbi:MAG: hypothetical protein FWC00_04610 [Firmicutes bacterium]|nr:hypothetical protein [Bacillota bacterium]
MRYERQDDDYQELLSAPSLFRGNIFRSQEQITNLPSKLMVLDKYNKGELEHPGFENLVVDMTKLLTSRNAPLFLSGLALPNGANVPALETKPEIQDKTPKDTQVEV